MISLTLTQKQKIIEAPNPLKKRHLLFRFCYPQIGTVIYADQTDQAIIAVIQKYSLDQNQYSLATSSILECLTGGLPIDQFASAFLQQSNIPNDIAQQAATEIQQAVLEPIRPLLEKAYQEFPQIQKEFLESQQPTANSQPPTTYGQQQPPPTQPTTRNPQPTTPNPQPIAPAPENLPTDESSRPSTVYGLPQTNDSSPPQPVSPNPLTRNSQPETHNSQPIQDIRFLAKKNPAILEQKITGNYLIESGSGQSIPPTVKNWLLDYVRIAGSGNHSSLDRGRYLIKSPNAKNLTEDERNLVNKIIESYDSGSPLTVDINTGLLLLPNKRISNFPAQGPNDVRTFQVMPVSFGSIVDLQDY